jgi:phage-related minor tail protein
VGAAALAVSHYKDKISEAQTAYDEIKKAVETLERLLADCASAEADGRESDVQQCVADANAALDAAEGVTVPVVEHDHLDDAKDAVAAAEKAVEEAQAVA